MKPRCKVNQLLEQGCPYCGQEECIFYCWEDPVIITDNTMEVTFQCGVCGFLFCITYWLKRKEDEEC